MNVSNHASLPRAAWGAGDPLLTRLETSVAERQLWGSLGGILRACAAPLFEAAVSMRHEPIQPYERALTYAGRQLSYAAGDEPFHADPRYLLGRIDALLDVCDAGIDRSVAETLVEQAQKRSHVLDILERLLARDEGQQPKRWTAAELADAVGIKPNHLSNILRWMEAADLVRRRASGQEVVVSIGPKGETVFLFARGDVADATEKHVTVSPTPPSSLAEASPHTTEMGVPAAKRPAALRTERAPIGDGVSKVALAGTRPVTWERAGGSEIEPAGRMAVQGDAPDSQRLTSAPPMSNRRGPAQQESAGTHPAENASFTDAKKQIRAIADITLRVVQELSSSSIDDASLTKCRSLVVELKSIGTPPKETAASRTGRFAPDASITVAPLNDGREAVQVAGREQIRRLFEHSAISEQDDYARFLSISSRLHAELAKLGTREDDQRRMHRALDKRRRFRAAVPMTADDLRVQAADHISLLEAIGRNDWDSAKVAVESWRTHSLSSIDDFTKEKLAAALHARAVHDQYLSWTSTRPLSLGEMMDRSLEGTTAEIGALLLFPMPPSLGVEAAAPQDWYRAPFHMRIASSDSGVSLAVEELDPEPGEHRGELIVTLQSDDLVWVDRSVRVGLVPPDGRPLKKARLTQVGSTARAHVSLGSVGRLVSADSIVVIVEEPAPSSTASE